MDDLIPPNYDHCQASITPAHGPFVLGPKPRPHQCNEPPAWLAVEVVAGRDGRHGAMTLCNECAKVMMDDADLRARVQLQPILRTADEGD